MVDDYSCKGEDRFSEQSSTGNSGSFSLNSADNREESSPRTQLVLFGAPLSYEQQVSEQEEWTQNRVDELFAMMKTQLQSY